VSVNDVDNIDVFNGVLTDTANVVVAADVTPGSAVQTSKGNDMIQYDSRVTAGAMKLCKSESDCDLIIRIVMQSANYVHICK